GSGGINARVGAHEVDGLNFTGTEANFPQATNQSIQNGRYFSDTENDHRANVVVVGHSVSDALYPGIDPVGKPLTIDGTSFRLIGVFAPRKGAGPNQQDLPPASPSKPSRSSIPPPPSTPSRPWPAPACSPLPRTRSKWRCAARAATNGTPPTASAWPPPTASSASSTTSPARSRWSSSPW